MSSISYLYSKLFKKYLRGKSIIGSNVHPTSTINSGSQVVNSTIDKYSNIGYDNTIIDTQIGAFCSFADNITIGSAQHHMEWCSTSSVFEDVKHSGSSKKFSHFPPVPFKRTVIGSDVWIGQNAIIIGGVNIGHGAVIGAGSIVTKDVEPYAIVAGNPAKLIRYRFDEDIRNNLLKSEWWTMNDEDLQLIADKIRSPHDFICAIKEARK